MAKPPPTIVDRIRDQGDFVLAGGVIGLVGIMLVPLPPFLLDLLLSSSIALALLLFLGAMYARKPVEFSVFPTVLLVATVFRLALNVASTRLILLHGSDGTSAAGSVIESFGQFVVGGNYVVGAIVFAILVIINFVVITKGSGRVAEVAARFTLDALPGKQMAIDAELNAGMIDESTARTRRSEVTREADFYGAMDGASKFIRGDAIAGIIITMVNVIGGAVIGVAQKGMPLGEAVQTYSILTIGDGLAGQVPALVVSIAAGMLVTRVQDVRDRALHLQVGSQLLENPRVMALVTAALLGLALIPGLRIPFLLLAALSGFLAWSGPPTVTEEDEDEPSPQASREPTPADLLPIETLAIEVAVDVLYLVDERRGGEILQRIQRIRSQFATDLGLLIPSVHLRDDMNLGNGQYVVRLRGEEIGRGRVYPRQHMALDPGTAQGQVEGIATTDPVFGLPAWWILDEHVLRAQQLGYSVVDVPTVLTTHLVELLYTHGHEIFDGPQLDEMLARISETDRRLVDDLVPDTLSRQTLLRVFRNLIREGISVRDGQTILEALARFADRTTEADVLTEFVRQGMARHITHRFTDEDGAIHYVRLAQDAEAAVLRGLQSTNGQAPNLVLDPEIARILIVGLREKVESYGGPGQAVVLCPPLARGALKRLLERVLPRIPVLSSAELLATAKLEPVGTVQLSQ
jgi:flagellar biosynthesis protein FlhA